LEEADLDNITSIDNLINMVEKDKLTDTTGISLDYFSLINQYYNEVNQFIEGSITPNGYNSLVKYPQLKTHN
jgi:hypothetical protein